MGLVYIIQDEDIRTPLSTRRVMGIVMAELHASLRWVQAMEMAAWSSLSSFLISLSGDDFDDLVLGLTSITNELASCMAFTFRRREAGAMNTCHNFCYLSPI